MNTVFAYPTADTLERVRVLARVYDEQRNGPAGGLFLDSGAASVRVLMAVTHAVMTVIADEINSTFEERVRETFHKFVSEIVEGADYQLLEAAGTELVRRSIEKEPK